MKICIFGGGSIGGLLAVNLEKIGINVSIVARGHHLEVMKKMASLLLTRQEKKILKLLLAQMNPTH